MLAAFQRPLGKTCALGSSAAVMETTSSATDVTETTGHVASDDYNYNYYEFGVGVTYEVAPVAFVYLIAVIGFLSNGSALFVMLKFKELRKHSVNILILNQTCADLTSSVLLILTYTFWIVKDSKLVGVFGRMLCHLFMKEQVFWMSFSVSTFNLAALTFERYLLVVHPITHRLHFKRWHLYIVVSIVWVMPFFYNLPDTVLTTDLYSGWCMFNEKMSSNETRVYTFIYFIGTFVLPLVILIYCYSHMLAVLWRQAKRINPGGNATAGDKDKKGGLSVNISRTQRNLTKTMVIVSVAFVLCLLPYQVYYIIYSGFGLGWNPTIYYPLLCISLLNLAINPVIYIFTMDKYKSAVRELLGSKLPMLGEVATVTDDTMVV